MQAIFRSAAFAALVAGAGFFAQGALAQSPVKIGFVSTMSGPEGVIGRDMADAFKLAMKHVGSKAGGRAIEVVWGDDQVKPDVGRQVVDKMLESDKVHMVTGIVFSNILLASVKPVLGAGAFYISANAGPSPLAGKQCHPRLFAVAFQNDNNFEGLGKHVKDKGFKKVYFLAPNYPAGKDMAAGFKRYYQGDMAAEVFTSFGQLDYSAEIAQLRAARPDAVVIFYPGGMGINFVKQYAQAGLMNQIPLFTGAGTVDQTTLPAIGDAALGMFTGALWSEFLDNPANKKFVADFEADYGRIPSGFASAAYDTGRAIHAALEAVGGKIEDKVAFQKAMENVKFDAVRGSFKFNKNHFPIHDYYMVQIEKDAKGRLVSGLRGTVLKDLADAYSGECNMAAQ